MPNLGEHCARTLKRYGVEGRDIHIWLDEPSTTYTGSHRQFRHDSNTVKLVGELFARTYGKELAENIALDHIMADHEQEIKNRNMVCNASSNSLVTTYSGKDLAGCPITVSINFPDRSRTEPMKRQRSELKEALYTLLAWFVFMPTSMATAALVPIFNNFEWYFISLIFSLLFVAAYIRGGYRPRLKDR